MLLDRKGYGSNFNVLECIGEKLIKKSKNSYGDEKIENELNFYRYLLNQQIPFCEDVPKIYKIVETDHSIEMEYLKDFVPLYLRFSSYTPEEQTVCLNTILDKLRKLHDIRIPVDRNEFQRDLFMETTEKVRVRMLPIYSFIQEYSFIHTVNSVKIPLLSTVLYTIGRNIKEYLSDQDVVYEYGMIHGDCQFNNILTNPDGDLKFIDPRGYYGSSRIYGFVDYDHAKICFALSGYDQFDNSTIQELIIRERNIDIDINIDNETFIMGQSMIVKTLMCAIWLGNAQMFKNEPEKCITSYFIAMYMCSKFLPNLFQTHLD